MTQFKLANPEWLLLMLALLPVLTLRVRAHFLSRRGLPGLVSPQLREQLISGTGSLWRWLRFSLGALAIALITIALARPQWGVEKIEAQSQGRNVLIAIDTSRSMMANDVAPDRLTRAKLAAQDIVNALPNDRIGLIAFSGSAYVQAPLTIDHAAVNETLQQFDTELIPRGGTNLSSAVSLAIDTFRKADIGESALIIFSDGEDLEGGEELVKLRGEAASAGMTIVAIAVGTESGAIIPDPEANQPGVFVKDGNGQIVRSRLNPLALQKISAEAENGLFLMLDGRRSIASVVAASLSQLEETAQDEIARERPIERFPIFLGLGLLFMIAAWLLPDFRKRRRSVVTHSQSPSASKKTMRSKFATPAGSGNATDLPPPPPQPVKRSKTAARVSVILILPLLVPTFVNAQQAGSDDVEPAGQTAPAFVDGRVAAETAMAALQKQDYKAALEGYQRALTDKTLADQNPELNLGLGSAAYKLGDFEQAKEAFGKVLESPNDQLAARGEYNLANTLFRHGETFLNAEVGAPNPKAAEEQWDTALEHYRGALELDPGNDRARHNAEVVEQRLAELREQQEKQDPPKSEDEDPPPPEDEEKEDEEEDEKEEDKDDKDDKKDDQDKGDENNQDQDNKGDGQDENKNQDPSKNNDQNQDPNKSQDPNSNPESNDKGENPEGGDGEQPPGGDQGQQPPGGQPPSPDGGGDDQNKKNSDQEKNQQPPGAQPQTPEGEPQKPEGGDGKQDQQNGSPQQEQPPASPQNAGADGQPAEPEPTPEGDLKADSGSQSQPANASPGQSQQAKAGQADQGERSEGDPNANIMNSETGFTPSEARRLLNTQSEEALRMMRVRVPSSKSGYRNW